MAAGAVDEVGEVGECLMAAMPTGVGTLDDVNDTCFIAHVRIVIHGECISVAIEGDFLWVSQPGVYYLKPAAVALHTEDGSLVLCVEMLAFFGFQIVATVADGEVDAVVGPECEAVQVVSAQANRNAVSFLQ